MLTFFLLPVCAGAPPPVTGTTDPAVTEIPQRGVIIETDPSTRYLVIGTGALTIVRNADGKLQLLPRRPQTLRVQRLPSNADGTGTGAANTFFTQCTNAATTNLTLPSPTLNPPQLNKRYIISAPTTSSINCTTITATLESDPTQHFTIEACAGPSSTSLITSQWPFAANDHVTLERPKIITDPSAREDGLRFALPPIAGRDRAFEFAHVRTTTPSFRTPTTSITAIGGCSLPPRASCTRDLTTRPQLLAVDNNNSPVTPNTTFDLPGGHISFLGATASLYTRNCDHPPDLRVSFDVIASTN